MQLLRFQTQNIFILQKSVQFCGRTIAKSKKRVRWVVKHNEDLHYITCSISFYSGKKRATHNGHTIIDLVDSQEQFDFIVLLGLQRMIFTVDINTEDAKVERKYNQKDGSFGKFKNVYSGEIADAFGKYFGDRLIWAVIKNLHLKTYCHRLKIKQKERVLFCCRQYAKSAFDYPERPMITTRLRKDCSAKTLMVEFSTNSLPQALEQFHRSCKEEGVVVLRGDLNSNQLNFYSVLPSSSVEVRGVKLQGNPQSPRFILAIHYISSQWQEQAFQHTSTPTKRTLLLRQGLDTKFYHEYQFQNTQSQLESVVFLCQLSSTIINCQFDEGVNFYDQKAEEIKGVSNDNLREKLWRNVFYQIPGLGKEKCNAIANKYPTYQSLLEDYMTQRKLKNLLVSRGTKEVKLGQVLANRIYRCLFTEDGSLAVAEQ